MRLLAPLLAALAAFAAGCAKPPPAAREAAPAPVSVAPAVKKTVQVQVRVIGTAEAIESVAVRPEVNGRLVGVHFKEGERITKGQELFTIDPARYKAAVEQAKAVLGRSEAAARSAKEKLALLQSAGTSAAKAETVAAEATLTAAEATVVVDKAALATAELELAFTTIRSPLDGRAGRLLVKTGNVVDSTTVSLVVVNQISPISVAVALPERELPAVVTAFGQGRVVAEAYLPDRREPIAGAVSFIDNQVNAASGTVQLKAEFPNGEELLRPGQFVEVMLRVRERPDSVTVPAGAVQTGQKGAFVFVVTADGKAELRPVTVEFEAGDEAVIGNGLNGGERVVTEGHLRLVPGAAVAVKADAPAGGKE